MMTASPEHKTPATDGAPFLSRLRVLIVEDSDNDALILAKMLERETAQFLAARARTREEMEAALDSGSFDVILCDHDMPDFSPAGALKVLKGRDLDIPFIIVTGAIGGEEAAVKLMRSGVADFIPKHKLNRLLPAIRREIREAAVRRAKRDADEALRAKNVELEAAVWELRQTQAELVRADRMQSLGTMVSAITHDLNNALSNILGVVETMERKEAPPGTWHTSNLRKAADEAVKTVKRLSYFCRVRPSEAVGDPVDIGSILVESLESARPRLERIGSGLGGAVEVVSQLREVPEVFGDAEHFRDAITNLIFNACDAMPEGGTLGISSYRDTRAVVVEIEDDGVGMTEEELEQCLEPFSTKGGGIVGGLGLAWIRALMERFGGIMRIESQEDVGTKVQLRFSICEKETTAGAAGEPGQSPLKIIVVDDEKVIADCLASYLEEDNHYVRTTRNGFEALEMLGRESFDIVISDRAMRELNGEELARMLKERGGGEKFIMATGSGDVMIANCETVEGVDVILPKPITREALRKAIGDAGAYLPA